MGASEGTLTTISLSFLALLQLLVYPVATHAQTVTQLQEEVKHHLLIGDVTGALEATEVYRALHQNNPTPETGRLYLKVLAAGNDEQLMLREWGEYTANTEVASDFATPFDRELLEDLSWAVIRNGSTARLTRVRLISLMAAAQTRAQEALPILSAALRSPTQSIRTVAASLAPFLGDQQLREELHQLLLIEHQVDVRVAIVQSLGQMQVKEVIPLLKEILGDLESPSKLRRAVSVAIVSMIDNLDRSELQLLAESNRFALRQLACFLVAQKGAVVDAEVIRPLVSDPHSEVRAAAIRTLGLLGYSDPTPFEEGVEDPDPVVAINAAWGLSLHNPEEGTARLADWILGQQKEWQPLAAAALAATGTRGVGMMKAILENSQLSTSDNYAKVNIALGLIGQREETDAAGNVLYEAVTHSKEQWMWIQESPIDFQRIVRSQAGQRPDIPNFPEVLNQATRLEILNALAIVNHPQAQNAIRSFLKEKTWGVVGFAAETLLREGDAKAVGIVRSLLKDPDPHVRKQAAFLLVSWGEEKEALTVLLDFFPTATRFERLVMLEVVGGLKGSGAQVEAVRFLSNGLGHPSQLLRVIAAAGLLQQMGI